MSGLASVGRLALAVIVLMVYGFSTAVKAASMMGSTVIGIDFGSQFIKISYVAPGGSDPLPIVLNDMSERKTPNAVAFRNGMPIVGSHAFKPILSKPKLGYQWLNALLGKPYDDPTTQSILTSTVHSFGKDEARGTIAVVDENGEAQPVEYLCGLLLSKLVEQTEMDCKKSVREVVLSVPPYFNQVQRLALLDSARIAGLRVLSLVNDISAAALYYGTFIGSKATEARHIVIVDSGATHTSAALAYVDPQHVEDGKTAILVEVKKTVSDTRLSGRALDQTIANILQAKFRDATGGVEIPKGKSLNRLMLEASRVKHILSANTDTRVNIEELVEDHHLSCDISREEFVQRASELHSMAADLVLSLFKDSEISLDSVFAIIPIGGNCRVPFVRDNLTSVFGAKLQYGLNMDDTVAKGAAWYAAMLSNFRVKPTRFRDTYPYAVDLSYLNEQSTQALVPVYQAHSSVNGHRSVSFKNIDSLKGQIMAESQGTLIEITTDEPVEAVISKLGEKKVISKKLKFWVDLNSSGLVEIKDSPVVLVEYEELQETAASATNSSEAPSNNTAPAETTTVIKTEAIPMKHSKKDRFSALSAEMIQKYQEKIKNIQDLEKALERKSAARNNLESNYYRIRDHIAQDEFLRYSQETEINAIRQNLSATLQALDAEEGSIGPEYYEEVLQKLLDAESVIVNRQDLHERWLAAAAKVKMAVESATSYVHRLRRDGPDAAGRAQNEEELDNLLKNAEGTGSWFAEVETEHASRGTNTEPLVPEAELRARAEALGSELASIIAKRITSTATTAPPTPTTNDSATTADTATTAPTDASPDQGAMEEKEEL